MLFWDEVLNINKLCSKNWKILMIGCYFMKNEALFKEMQFHFSVVLFKKRLCEDNVDCFNRLPEIGT